MHLAKIGLTEEPVDITVAHPEWADVDIQFQNLGNYEAKVAFSASTPFDESLSYDVLKPLVATWGNAPHIWVWGVGELSVKLL